MSVSPVPTAIPVAATTRIGPVFFDHSRDEYRISWAISPARIGAMIMFRMENIIGRKGIGMMVPASSFISSGVITGESIVEQAVIVTERATSPRARKTIRLEATPPETEPIRITPTELREQGPVRSRYPIRQAA